MTDWWRDKLADALWWTAWRCHRIGEALSERLGMWSAHVRPAPYEDDAAIGSTLTPIRLSWETTTTAAEPFTHYEYEVTQRRIDPPESGALAGVGPRWPAPAMPMAKPIPPEGARHD